MYFNLSSLAVPNPPTLRVILPRFSTTYLVWRDPEPFVGDIIGVEIRYLIDCVLQNIPEQGGGVNQYSVSGIKGSEGKTHSISLRARTTAGWGIYSTPVEFVFRPIGEIHSLYNYISPHCIMMGISSIYRWKVVLHISLCHAMSTHSIHE